jgi:hypothetical protein
LVVSVSCIADMDILTFYCCQKGLPEKHHSFIRTSRTKS